MFPFTQKIQVSPQLSFESEQIHQQVFPLLTEARQKKIDTVVRGRTFNNVVVLEDIYDRGNISAVMRSAEAMGFAQFHIIEKGDKFKESQRVTAGADKWLEVTKWKSSTDCILNLKKQGKAIYVTHLDHSSVPISDIDFTKPCAIVLGNEKDGASDEILALADKRVILPMCGFVQSYNISVAGALCFYSMMTDRIRRQGFHGDLSLDEQKILQAVYSTRTLDSAEEVLRYGAKK